MRPDRGRLRQWALLVQRYKNKGSRRVCNLTIVVLQELPQTLDGLIT
jgi:hypothetical protein